MDFQGYPEALLSTDFQTRIILLHANTNMSSYSFHLGFQIIHELQRIICQQEQLVISQILTWWNKEEFKYFRPF